MPPAGLTILADDLTGACDAAAPFAARQGEAVVLLDGDVSPPMHGVVAYDLDLRDRDAGETFAGAREAAARRCRRGNRVFVKIDSTLRGHIAELVSGVLEGAGGRATVIAPALPQQGRGLVNARLVLASGDGAAEAPDLLRMLERAGWEAEHVSLDAGVSTASVEKAIRNALRNAIRYVVVDGRENDDLKAVALAALEGDESVHLAGSAGLATALAEATAGAPRTDRRVPEATGPVLVVAGSPATATRRQVNHLARGRCVRVVRPPCEGIELDGAGAIVVLSTAPEDESAPVTRDDARSSQALARCVAALAGRGRPRGVVLAGGSTARAVCRGIGASGVTLCGEAAPGLPCGVVRGGVWDGVAIVTKSGGFGAPTLLEEAVKWCNPELEHA